MQNGFGPWRIATADIRGNFCVFVLLKLLSNVAASPRKSTGMVAERDPVTLHHGPPLKAECSGGEINGAACRDHPFLF